MITQQRLKQVLSYCPTTGEFRWRVSRKGTKGKGSIAGSVNYQGYRRIVIDGENYLAHRLAILHERGYWPENPVTHRNGRSDENHIENLQEVSMQCVMQAGSKRSDNTSGFKGIYWDKKANKYQAQITINGKTTTLGLFDQAIDAARHRVAYISQHRDRWNCLGTNQEAIDIIEAQL